MRPVRLAVIGAGLIGRKHIELASTSSQCQLVAISDNNPDRRVLAEEFGMPFYSHYEEMLDKAKPEGVIIATPTEVHTTVGIACAKRSVHLLVEKPIADSVDTGRSLLKVADENGVQVLVGHHRRFNPLVQQAHDKVQGGKLGRLVSVTAMWFALKPKDYYDVVWRTKPGGGPLLINMIHEIDTLRYICGEIETVYAATSSAVRGFEVEDSASITLQFENGVLGSLSGSDTTPSPWSYEITSFENPAYSHRKENCYYFFGSKGSLAFPRMELWRYDDNDAAGWNQSLIKSQLNVEPGDPLRAQLLNFCRVIRGEESPVVSGEEGLRTLSATLAVLESARRGSPVHLREVH